MWETCREFLSNSFALAPLGRERELSETSELPRKVRLITLKDEVPGGTAKHSALEDPTVWHPTALPPGHWPHWMS